MEIAIDSLQVIIINGFVLMSIIYKYIIPYFSNVPTHVCVFVQPEQDTMNMIFAACHKDNTDYYCAKDYHDYKTDIGGNHYDVWLYGYRMKFKKLSFLMAQYVLCRIVLQTLAGEEDALPIVKL